MTSQDIYNVAKAGLGTHLTLDPTVDPELGCAEAVSTILAKAGVQGIPQRGFAGTHDLWQWLKTNRQFTETVNPEVGGVTISPTGTSVQGADQHGHCGIVMQQGICSNNSSTGMWHENYTYDSWVESFGQRGFPTYYFALSC